MAVRRSDKMPPVEDVSRLLAKLAGILSVTDVCRVLAEILREQFPASGGNDAA